MTRIACWVREGAFNYIRNHWEALKVFVTDGSLPIDNNQGERLIINSWPECLMRRVAVDRKNWLFVGSMRAGRKSFRVPVYANQLTKSDHFFKNFEPLVLKRVSRRYGLDFR